MKKLKKASNWIFAFIWDTLMAWLFAIMLVIPILGTQIYRNVRRITNAIVKIQKLSEVQNIMTVDEYMEKKRK